MSPTPRQRWRDAIREADDPALDVYAIAVALALDHFMNAAGRTTVGHRRLAKLARVSRPTVEDRLARLVDTGWLTRDWTGRGSRAAYRVATPIGHSDETVANAIGHSTDHAEPKVANGVAESGQRGWPEPVTKNPKRYTRAGEDDHDTDTLQAVATMMANEGVGDHAIDDWLWAMLSISKRFTADEVERVTRWLLKARDPVAKRWKPLIVGPPELLEHWPAMRAEYLDHVGRRVVEPVPSNGTGRTKPTGDPEFDTFWQSYPKHVDKGHARTAWRAAIRKAEPEAIVAGARRYAAERAGKDPQYTAGPATWLRGERWADEPEAGVANAGVDPTTGLPRDVSQRLMSRELAR
jgi:hypothetical protein